MLDSELASAVASISGTATAEQKAVLIVSWPIFCGAELHFAGGITERIRTVRYDAEEHASGRVTTELECELKVEQDMVNAYNKLHGGCSAFLVDLCTSVCLLPFIRDHVTIALNIICHAAAELGTTLRIVSKTTSIGKRVLAMRCEILDQKGGRLYVSGTHIKTPANL